MELTARAAFEQGVRISSTAGLVDPATLRAEYAALCSYLAAVPRGEIVGFHLAKQPRYLLAICAALETGTPFVPLHTAWPAARIEQVVAITACRTVLDAGKLAAICEHGDRAMPSPPIVAPDAPAYVICTSGTTGRPKAVVISRAAYANFVQWVGDYFVDIGPSDTALLTADFTFDMSLLNVALVLARGTGVHVSSFTNDIFALASEIVQHEISVLVTVPNTMSSLLMSAVRKRFALDGVRHLLLGGSRYSYGVYQTIREALPAARCYNLYGPTECTVYSHVKELGGADDVHDHNISIGKTIANTTCLIVDANDAEVDEAYTSGELLLGGRQVLTEYLGDLVTTAAAITVRDGERYYRTGDLSFRDDRGNYFIAGRLDETLKRRGFRVNLLDIDSYIQRLEAVRECMTIAIAHPVHEHLLATFAVVDSGQTEDQLLAAVRGVLVEYQVPDELRVVAELPRGATGKVDRKRLEELFHELPPR